MKVLPNLRSCRFRLLLSSKCFIVLALTLWSLTELFFCTQISSSACWYPVVPAPFFGKTTPLNEWSWHIWWESPYMPGLISELSVLFCWFIYHSLCHYHTFFLPHPQHMEVPRPGIEPKPQQWQCQILKPLYHQWNSHYHAVLITKALYQVRMFFFLCSKVCKT